jgi:hypothetical protein
MVADVGGHIAQPSGSRADGVVARLETPHRARSGRWLAAAAAVAVVALTVTAFAPAREAIANLLGLGTTTVQHVDELPASVPTTLPGGRGTDAELRAELGRANLSAPPRALVGDPVAWNIEPADESVVVWRDVALTQSQTTEPGLALKLVPRDSDVVQTNVRANPALWVPGRHVRQVEGTNFAADSALVWVADATMYRLETSLPLERARAIAESLAPVR